MKKIIALISCVVAVNFLLSGCSSKDESNHSPEKSAQTEVTKPSDQIAGRYVLVSGIENGKAFTAEEYLKDINDYIKRRYYDNREGEPHSYFREELYIDLKTDGTGNTNLDPDQEDPLTWRAVSDTEIEVTIYDGTARANIKDGFLFAEDDDIKLTFKKK